MDAKYRNLQLDTPAQVRNSLSKVARWVLADEIDTKKANCFGYMCTQILGSIRVDEQEKRIAELENIIVEYENR